MKLFSERTSGVRALTTTESTVLPPTGTDGSGDNVAPVPTSLANVVTIEQTYNGPDDWSVQQSVTDTFSDTPSNVRQRTARSALLRRSVQYQRHGIRFVDDGHSIAEKTRFISPGEEYGYTQVSMTDVQTFESDQHLTISLGTEEMLVDVGSSGNSDVLTDASTKDWAAGLPGSEYEDTVLWNGTTFVDNSQASYEFGLTLGGTSGFGLTNESSFDVGITATEEMHDESDGDSGYRYVEVYRDYSDDVADAATAAGQEPEERIHRKTETFFSPEATTVNIMFEHAPGADVPGQESGRSREDILAEYRDLQIQKKRLETLLDSDQTMDDAMRQILEDQVAMLEQNLVDLTQEADDAGISASDLETVEDEAAAAAADDPIEFTTIDELGEDDDSNAPGYWHFLMNPSDMDDDLEYGFTLRQIVCRRNLRIVQKDEPFARVPQQSCLQRDCFFMADI